MSEIDSDAVDATTSKDNEPFDVGVTTSKDNEPFDVVAHVTTTTDSGSASSLLPTTQRDFMMASEKILNEISDSMNNAAATMTETFASSGKIATRVQEILKSTADSLQDEKDREIRQLKYQLKSMEILLSQNAALEKEVDRLCAELDEASHGVTKRGYLYKWRDREIYYAPKWGLRYFVVHGNKLSYYGDEHERRPRRTINLSKCYVKNEGTKKNGSFHVFSIFLTESHDDTLDDTLLLKLSSDNAAEALLWIDILEQACSMKDEGEGNDGKDGSLNSTPQSLSGSLTESDILHSIEKRKGS